jgi:transcriptional regulator with XRE-family HTH domain
MTDKHPHIYTCLGQVINERRKKLGMSQEELAAKSGIDRAFISNVERGKRSPSFRSVAHLAGGLKMRYSRLVHKCEECERTRHEDDGPQ